jgi:hypothetical protein
VGYNCRVGIFNPYVSKRGSVYGTSEEVDYWVPSPITAISLCYSEALA